MKNYYKLKIKLQPSNEKVPLNINDLSRRAVYTWLRKSGNFTESQISKIHDEESYFNISELSGGSFQGDHFSFSNGGFLIISSMENETDKFMKSIIKGAKIHTEFIKGIYVDSAAPVKEEIFKNSLKGFTLSPILLKALNRETGEDDYLTYKDKNADEHMTRTFIEKLGKLCPEIDSSGLEIRFSTYPEDLRGRRIKPVKINGNKKPVFASVCPVMIKANNIEAVKACFYLGIGKSNGAGFGMICLKRNDIFNL
jgi:CRISPR-associated endoribonuclease Cas6